MPPPLSMPMWFYAHEVVGGCHVQHTIMVLIYGCLFVIGEVWVYTVGA